MESRISASPLETTLDEGTLDDVRNQASQRVFAFVLLIGLGLAVTLQVLPEAMMPRLITLLLMTAPLVAWTVSRQHYRAGVWLLVTVCLAVILIMQITYPPSVAIVALAFLAGACGFLISKWAGFAAALGSTALLLVFAGRHLLPPGQGIVPMTLVLIWGVQLLAWTAIEPLYTLLRWSWYYYDRARALADEAGNRQVELLQTLEDLSESNRQLEHLNRIVQAAQAEAEEARRTKVEFVANVSHELRTPLNMITGFAETLLEAPRVYKLKLPRALMADIDAIYRNGVHLQGLIDDVLDLSQIDMHRMALVKERTDLRRLIGEAIEAVQFQYESRQLSLTVELSERLPELLCDRTRIREVFLNLLSNAGRFTERGGTTVRARESGGFVVVSITDTGPGIPREKLDKLFEPFQQLDTSIRRRFGGSGLGLAISRAFVEMHRGHMWVESEPGRGTTIFFDLPCVPEMAEPTPLPADRYIELRARPPRGARFVAHPRLAVIDDSHFLERLIGRYLPEVQIVPATTLAQASAEHQIHPLHAMIANAPTPEQMTAYLAQQPALPQHVPLLLTAFSATSSAAHLLGVTSYLVKPITREKLMQTLAALAQPVETILVADDDLDVQQLFGRMLALEQDRRYRVLEASNGHEALNLLRARRPDVLLLDLVMPDMDGYEVLREKNRDPAIRDIPVLIISARDLMQQPMASPTIVATRRESLSAPEVLESITELSRLLGLLPIAGDPARPEMRPA